MVNNHVFYSQTSRYLVGRIFSFYLYPFSFSEYVNVKNKKLGLIFSQNSQRLKEFLFNGKSLKTLLILIDNLGRSNRPAFLIINKLPINIHSLFLDKDDDCSSEL